MKLTERMLEGEKKEKRDEKRRADFWQNEEDSVGYMYEDDPKWEPLNRTRGVFARKDDGIDTAENVFDRTAIFRTDLSD